ncbi:acyltransferase [Shewanella sp. 125m-7]
MLYLSKLKHKLREKVLYFRYVYFKAKGVNIARTARVSLGAKLDPVAPRLITIGNYTQIADDVIILTHDYSRDMKAKTVIGNNSFIGVKSVIMPGVHIGDHVVIGAGSIVTKNIESNSLAAGNPCKVLKEGINTERYGKIIKE